MTGRLRPCPGCGLPLRADIALCKQCRPPTIGHSKPRYPCAEPSCTRLLGHRGQRCGECYKIHRLRKKQLRLNRPKLTAITELGVVIASEPETPSSGFWCIEGCGAIVKQSNGRCKACYRKNLQLIVDAKQSNSSIKISAKCCYQLHGLGALCRDTTADGSLYCQPHLTAALKRVYALSNNLRKENRGALISV